MMKSMTNREEYVVDIMDRTVSYMLSKFGKVNIDEIEVRFEDGCTKCRMNKDCDRCAIQAKFIEILEKF